MCSGSRKKDAKFRKKKKLAAVVVRNGPDITRARIEDAYLHPPPRTRRVRSTGLRAGRRAKRGCSSNQSITPVAELKARPDE
jgi:hypothetical protein